MAWVHSAVAVNGSKSVTLGRGKSQSRHVAKLPACALQPSRLLSSQRPLLLLRVPLRPAFSVVGGTVSQQKGGVVRVGVVKDVFDELDLEENESEYDSELEDAEFVHPSELKDRPLARGFGQGRTYDTSLEDELMEQIEATRQGFTKKRQGGDAPIPQQREGGAARKKRPPPPPAVEYKGSYPWLLRGTPEDRYPPNTPAGVKVNVGNLPKKKKVGKDLRKALLAVPGLLVIRPSEIGDRNTRDCTCKGAATLIFKDEQYAQGFCMAFQGRPVQFGKIERRITAKLADTRQQQAQGVSAPEGEEDAQSDEPSESEVDQLIEEGQEKGMEQLQRQNQLEEEHGRKALLEGVPQVEEKDLQEATVKSPQDSHVQKGVSSGKAASANKEPDSVDEMIEEGKEAGSEQLQKQRQKEESGGKDSLLGRPADKGRKQDKDGEDGRSDALSNNENEMGKGRDAIKQGEPQVGMTLAKAVAVQETSKEDEFEDVDVDAMFDEEDLLDEALDEEVSLGDEGPDEREEEEDSDEDWEDVEYELEVSDFMPGTEAPPRSAKVTRVLEDGTLIVRGQTVGKVDPAAAKDGQLAVPADVAARIEALTQGQPLEVDVVTADALAAKRAFEEKLVAWHFGQLPGFEAAERPSKEDVRVTWDRANQTMVKVGGFDKAKHKRLKAEQREPQNLQQLLRERTAESEMSEDDTDEDVEGEEEWELEEDSDTEGDEKKEGISKEPQAANRVVSKVARMDFAELLAAEKRELAEGIERLRAQKKAVPVPSQDVLDTIERLKADPTALDQEEDLDVDEVSAAEVLGSRKSVAKQASQERRKEGVRGSRGEGAREEGSKRAGSMKTKKSSSLRQRKPEYRELLASIQKGT